MQFNDGQIEKQNRLYDWSLVLVLWTWACHLEVERTAFHCHLHGNERRLKVAHLREKNREGKVQLHLSMRKSRGYISNVICNPEVQESYSAYEVISVFPPHVTIGGHIHSLGLKRSQCPRVWQDKECCTFSMSQQAAQKLCQ